MLKKFLLGATLIVAVVVGALAVFVAMQPAEFRLVRSRTMTAPPEAVFAAVNDFHRWAEWSPWEHLDPNQKTDIGGPATGKDAYYAWSGNDKAGEGKMTILESVADERIDIRLEFKRPMVATNDVTFAFKPEGTGTRVEWTMSGTNDFVGRAFWSLFNLDDLLAKDFDKGLAALDEATAKSAAPKVADAH